MCRISRVAAAVLSGAIGVGAVLPAAAQLAASDFSQGIQGWTLAGNGSGGLAHAGDHVLAVDSDPADLAFVAPPAFLGDKALAYR
ncbi:MAG: hypothetical protein AAF937_02885, partial [Planctomycetota bacterium]